MNKSKQPVLYLRGLKSIPLSVFCVDKEQKFFYDPIYCNYNSNNRKLPYSSGQQVKRSIMEEFLSALNVQRSSVTFVFKQPKLSEAEVLSLCDPNYPDQLIGGWMLAKDKDDKKKGKKKGKDSEEKDDNVLKRRSPLSISAMVPLHPLLVGYHEENVSFDRSDNKDLHKVKIRNENGDFLSEEEVQNILDNTHRDLYRKWIPSKGRASGLFVYDVAIDLRTLFSVSVHDLSSTIELDSKKWIRSKNIFGDCWTLCKEEREKIIPALAHALIHWRITSNQARTFSLMETLAVAISDNANAQAGAIRAKLIDDGGDKPKAKPIVDEKAGAELFVALPCAAYIVVENESADALEAAEKHLIHLMQSFDYENQC